MEKNDEMTIGQLEELWAELMAKKNAEAAIDGRISTTLLLEIISVENRIRELRGEG